MYSPLFFGAGNRVYLGSFVSYFIFTFLTGWRPVKVCKNGDIYIFCLSHGFLSLQLWLTLFAVMCTFSKLVGQSIRINLEFFYLHFSCFYPGR